MARVLRSLPALALLAVGASLTPANAADPAWSATVLVETGEKLGGLATGDLDASAPGDEVAVVSVSGRVRLLSRDGAGWKAVEAVRLGGEAIQVAVGDADRTRPGLEIVAFGMEKGEETEDGAGVATLVFRSGAGWSSEVVAKRTALVHGGCVADVDPTRPGAEVVLVGYDGKAVVASRSEKGWETVAEVALASEGKTAIPFGSGAVVACRGGTVEVVERHEGQWRSRVLATFPAGAARLGTDGKRLVVACDDGALRLIDGDAVRVLHQEKEKCRGAVLADLDPAREGLEAAAAGYGGVVTLLGVGAEPAPRTLHEGAGRLHHLAPFALPAPAGRTGLLTCGYEGKVLLLVPRD